MTEYIKREDAMDAVLDVYYNTPDIDLNGERLETAILKVQPADTVPAGRLRGVTYEDGNVTSVHIMDTDDVVKVFAPVAHGRWIASHDEFCACSICKYPVYVGWNQTNYCPNCGAKMDGGDDGETD